MEFQEEAYEQKTGYTGAKNYQSAQIVQANATGFGAASDDFMERGIDLNEQLVRNKPATFSLGLIAMPCLALGSILAIP